MSQIIPWLRTSTPRCREIILEILKAAHPAPLKTQTIYDIAHKDYPDEKASLPPSSHGQFGNALGWISAEYMDDSKKVKKRPIHANQPLKKQCDQPPHPEHPIRSIKYLKTAVLQDLVSRGKVNKIHWMREPTPEEVQRAKEFSARRKSKRNKAAGVAPVVLNAKGMIDQWGWVLRATEPDTPVSAKELERIEKAIDGQRRPDDEALEKAGEKQFLEEWGHLNDRRRRARKDKIEREDKWAAALERVRREGMEEAREAGLRSD